MPSYVTIKNKKSGRTMGINADIWAIEKERNKANKDYEFEEVHPVTITIPRKSVNISVNIVEKKSQDVADEGLHNAVGKALSESLTPENPEASKNGETPIESNNLTPEADVKVETQPEPKKRGRPFKK